MGDLWKIIRKQLRGKTMIVENGAHQNFTYEEFEIERVCNNLEKQGVVTVNKDRYDDRPTI